MAMGMSVLKDLLHDGENLTYVGNIMILSDDLDPNVFAGKVYEVIRIDEDNDLVFLDDEGYETYLGKKDRGRYWQWV